MSENLDINALFLGPKAENAEVFEKLIMESFRDHIFWRRNFHPEDPLALTQTDKRTQGYEGTLDNLQTKFYELISKLKCSVPFHSPRYLGHMQADLLMPAMIGYFSSMLYNPNNVCYEASPVTSEFEIEVGRDLAGLMGFDPKSSWAHLASGGTVANIEALWVIRNIKYFPLIAQDLVKKHNKKLDIELANGKVVDITEISDDYALLSLCPESLSKLTWDFQALDWGVDIQQEIYSHKRNISHSGMSDIPIGKVLVPSSKHYSWPKAAEILGIGRSNIEPVNVDENFRMDPDDLKEKLYKLYQQKIPVLAVIGIVGSTECGSVDPIDKIVEIRKWYEKECNSSFYLHIDAAYGGYPRSIFLNEDNYTFRPLEEMQSELTASTHFKWPSSELYNSYKAISEAESVTVDPHKLGYIPYPAGAIIFKDKRVKPATLVKAPYINNTTKANDDDSYIGSYILEGSKPGASAAACWLAHKVVPLNKKGYGEIISGPIKNAHLLFDILVDRSPIKIQKEGKEVSIEVRILNHPDLDILLYLFNMQGNTSLEKMNRFNELLLDELSFKMDQVIGAHDFLVSSTDFNYDIYGSSINPVMNDLGIFLEDWTQNVKNLKILRSSVVTTFVNNEESQNYYWTKFADSIKLALEKVVKSEEF